MAHHSIPEPEPDLPEPVTPTKRFSPSVHSVRAEEDPTFEQDLVQLTAKFSSQEGGNLSAELSVELALEVVLNEIVEQACLVTRATGAAIILERGGEMVCRASTGVNAPELGARMANASGLTAECIKTQQVQRCDDAEKDSRADAEACRDLGVRSVVVIPLLQKGELAGLFEVFSQNPSAFGERDERTLEALSRRVLSILSGPPKPLPSLVEAPPTNAETRSNTAPDDSVVRSPLPTFAALTSASTGRGVNVITWTLGIVLLGVAVLLATILEKRLLGVKNATRHHPRTVAAPAVGPGNRATMIESKATATPLAEDGAGLSKSAGVTLPGTAAAGSVVAATKGRATRPTIPEGSLLVYENGKEVFRMSPGSERASPKSEGDVPAGAVEPASKLESAGVYELSPQAAEARVVHRVEPEYPEEARQQQVQGPVVLEVRAGRDGAVQEVQVISGSQGLTNAAVAAVRQWRFNPPKVQGQPVEIQTRVTLNFKLPK